MKGRYVQQNFIYFVLYFLNPFQKILQNTKEKYKEEKN